MTDLPPAPRDEDAAPLPDLQAYLRAVVLRQDTGADFSRYPFHLPAVRALESLALHPRVTFLVGENGSGKSTLLEAIAVAAGLNAEGGSPNMRFTTRASESELHRHLRLVRGVRRPRTSYFLRAESFYNVASAIDRAHEEDPGHPALEAHGGRSLHAQSHGESFLALLNHRFYPRGLYFLDEPEAALSPQRQLAVLQILHTLVHEGESQFVIATHSPLLLAYPHAWLYQLGTDGIRRVTYEQTEHYALTRDFLNNREGYLRRLLVGSP